MHQRTQNLAIRQYNRIPKNKPPITDFEQLPNKLREDLQFIEDLVSSTEGPNTPLSAQTVALVIGGWR